MANLSIDYEALTTCSEELKSVNDQLKEKLNTIATEMKAVNTQDVYFSTDAQACLERFENMANKRIPEFEGVINEYVKMLQDTVNLYKETNQSLKSNVEDGSQVDAFV